MTDKRRALPSIDRLMRLEAVKALVGAHGREPVVRAAREAVAGARDNDSKSPGAEDAAWASAVARMLESSRTPTLRRCINATGVVLHTNLGRAPLAEAAIRAVREAASGYSSLEFDLEHGARGDRHVHCAGLLTALTGAQDALVVNNAASALVLAVAAAASGGDVVVSRGELVEIGGGFRIPDIMEVGGARLLEVGTTNRTRIGDYQKALELRGTGERGHRGTGKAHKARSALLKVHRSNFRMDGFTAEASLAELVALGRKKRVPVLYDLGSGLMQQLDRAGLEGEPTLPDAVSAGVHAVIASGDKLLGGPQAGIIAGRKSFIAACRKHPFARAARADKLTLAALSATLSLYQSPERAWREIPVLRLLGESVGQLDQRAHDLAGAMPESARATVKTTRAAVGGGSFPGVTLESRGVVLAPETMAAQQLAAKLRSGEVPVVAVINEGRVVIDVRSLLPGEDSEVASMVREALA